MRAPPIRHDNRRLKRQSAAQGQVSMATLGPHCSNSLPHTDTLCHFGESKIFELILN